MKRKGVLILLTAIIITFGICVIPAAVFKIQDYALGAKSFVYHSPTEKLSPKALDIALVRSLRERQPSNYGTIKVMFSDLKQTKHSVADYGVISAQLKVLETAGVLPIGSVNNKKIFSFNNRLSFTYNITADKESAFCFINVDDTLYEIEQTNQKITKLTLPNNNGEFSSLDTTEVIKSYLSYLGLDILGDWEYKGSYAQSAGAGLKVICLVDNDLLTLAVNKIS